MSEILPYIIPDIRDWPIFKLSQDREAFIEELKENATQAILNQKRKGSLSEDIAKVLYQERQRIKEDPWKVDPADDDDFWRNVRKELVKHSLDNDSQEEAAQYNKQIVEEIVERYAKEITGSFQISAYRFARKALTYTFRTILNAASLRSIKRVMGGETLMQDKIKTQGEIEHLRQLATKGTVILVPTHFSNLDSIVIGWTLDRIGLPAFSYGAGLNLYNSRPFAYFMGRLGAYTVDRRKKNAFYLETLKTFSKQSILRGTHTLFFPGGTRSRSGQLETKLKMGLLGSVIDAQCDHYIKGEDTKIFIVPLVLNYHFVLEAKGLIEQYLANTGKEFYLVEKNAFGGARQLLKFFWQLFSVSSEIVMNFGKPMDIMGNFVDENGNSKDTFGEPIDIKEYFISGGQVRFDRQRNEQYTARLAEKLTERYYAENVVLTSHLLAFTAFNLFRKAHPNTDLYGIMRLPADECVIESDTFRAGVEKVVNQLLQLASNDRLMLSYQIIHGSLDDIINHGMQNMGAYHAKSPLFRDKKGNFITEDMRLLYYYHNRLDGYGLSKAVQEKPFLSMAAAEAKF